MLPATLHGVIGVGVITKLYFVIFCGIEGVNDLESRSEVIGR